MKTPDLKECREKLDGIDREIVRLFEERMAVCGQVAEYKIETGKAVYDGEREKEVEEIRKKDVRVVFQGVEGAYSHAAVRMYFGEDADAYHVEKFEDTIKELERGQADYAVLFPLKTPLPASSSPTMTCYPDMTIISWERSMCLWTMCS